jgi:HSP20 family molecular chaperone IbpA
MQTELIQVMRAQVQAIHRALTGTDVPEPDADEPQTAATGDDEVTDRFLELEAAARALPALAERLPTFSFTPPLDVVAGDDAVILELWVPGVDRADVDVALEPGRLVVTGIRRDEAHGGYHYAETPRGPFLRAIPLPFALDGEPRVELERGVLRIFSAADPTGVAARNKNTGEQIDDDRDG